MAHMGKKTAAAAVKVDRSRAYQPVEAVALAKEIACAKFDETVELHLRLGVDPRHADQQVRGVMSLPHGTGREVRVLVFADTRKRCRIRSPAASATSASCRACCSTTCRRGGAR